MTRLANIHTTAIDAARTVWGHLDEPVATVWAIIATMPLPVALVIACAGIAIAEALDQRHN